MSITVSPKKIITSPFRRSSRCGKFTAGYLWLTKVGKIQPKPKPPSATHCLIWAGNNSEPSTIAAVNPRNPATSLILRRCLGEAWRASCNRYCRQTLPTSSPSARLNGTKFASQSLPTALDKNSSKNISANKNSRSRQELSPKRLM